MTVPKLHITEGSTEREVELAKESVTVGRSSSNDVVIGDSRSSRQHCTISRRAGAYVIMDMSSRNGTLLNGTPIHEQVLKDGDKAEIGDVVILFVLPGSPAPGPTAPAAAPPQPAPADPNVPFFLGAEGSMKNGKVPIPAGKLTVGRSRSNMLRLKDSKVSKHHFEITFDPATRKCVLKDLGSTNGTLVDGKNAIELTLENGAIVEIGGEKLVFTDPLAPAPQAPPQVIPLEQPAARQAAQPAAPAEKSAAAKYGAEAPAARKRSMSGILVFTLLGGAAILAALYFGLPPLLKLLVDKKVLPPLPAKEESPGLLPNGSFEKETTTGKQMFEGWTYSAEGKVQFGRDEAGPKHGLCSLMMKLDPPTPSNTVAECASTAIPVTRGSVFVLEGSVRALNSAGIAGFKATWLSGGKPVGETFSRFIAGDTGAWEQLKFDFVPPRDADSAVFSCVAAGRFGVTWFDALQLTQRKATPEDFADTTFALGADIELSMTGAGTLTLKRGGKTVFRGVGIAAKTPQDATTTQRFAQVAEGYPKVEPGRMFKTKFKLLEFTSGRWVDVNLSVESAPAGLKVEYKVDVPGDLELSSLSVVINCGPDILANGISLATEDGLQVKTGAFPVIAGVIEICAGEPARPIALVVPSPMPCHLDSDADNNRLWLTTLLGSTALRSFVLGFTVSANPTAAGKRIAAAIQEADAVFDASRYADAAALYKKLISECGDDASAKAAGQAGLKKIETRARDTVAKLSGDFEKWKSGGKMEDVVPIAGELENQKKQFAGTDYEKDFTDLENAIKEAVSNKTPEPKSKDADAANLLDQAHQAVKEEKWLWAEVLCKNVIQQFADTKWSDEATKLLEEVKAGAKAAKERDDWISSSLGKARNFVSNHMPEKAVPIFEEVLAKYPNSPLVKGVKEELEQAKGGSK